ncbi:hypothetical protein [Colwellia sp. M166]|nr:hypothetical protein [Colwellia sp. M166]
MQTMALAPVFKVSVNSDKIVEFPSHLTLNLVLKPSVILVIKHHVIG